MDEMIVSSSNSSNNDHYDETKNRPCLSRYQLLHVRMWRVALRHAYEMLFDRGFVVPHESPSFSEEDDEKEECGNLLQISSVDESIQWQIIDHATDPGQKILLWCFCKDKLNIESIKSLLSMMEEKRVYHGYVIFQHTITTSAKKILKNLYRFDIEIFSKEELQYNVTRFHYYCPHFQCSAKESQKILREWTSRALPVLLSSDPVCRHFHFPKGSIIRIQRKDQKIAYRIVL